MIVWLFTIGKKWQRWGGGGGGGGGGGRSNHLLIINLNTMCYGTCLGK